MLGYFNHSNKEYNGKLYGIRFQNGKSTLKYDSENDYIQNVMKVCGCKFDGTLTKEKVEKEIKEEISEKETVDIILGEIPIEAPVENKEIRQTKQSRIKSL